MLDIRESLKHGWIERKNDPRWQHMFTACYAKDVNSPDAKKTKKEKSLKLKAAKSEFEPRRIKPEISAQGKVGTCAGGVKSEPVQPKLKSPLKKELHSTHDQTPPKKKTKFKFDIDLVTPERPDPPEKNWRVGEAKPAKIFHRAEQTHALRVPGQTQGRASFLEPAPVNLEEMYSKAKMDCNASASQTLVRSDVKFEKPPAEDVDVELVDEQALKEGQDQLLVALPQKRKRAKHSRLCLRKEPSHLEVQTERLMQYFSRQGLSYGEFRKAHRRFCEIARAGECVDGGWLQFRRRIRLGNPPKCKSCTLMMDKFQVSIDAAAKAVECGLEAGQAVTAPEVSRTEDAEHEAVGNAIVAHEQDDLSEYDQCVAFVKSFEPHIQLADSSGNVKNYDLAYRCTLCTTRAQPAGKLNSLVKPKLKYVKRFLLQHINGPTHQQRLAQFNREQEKAEELVCVPCPGLTVSDPDIGSLHHYESEFALWATHSNLTRSMCKNKIWCDLSNNAWHARHSQCPEQMPQGERLCTRCKSLAEPRGLQRLVVGFMSKHYAARLLSAKMFGTKVQLDDVLSEVQESSFGQRHKVFWEKLKRLHIVELQKFVRKSFDHMGEDSLSDRMKAFIGAVVKPCIEVNACAVSSKIPGLSVQFANALANRDLTELESLSVAVGKFALEGRFDSNPLLQGLLVQCMGKIERWEAGKSTRGRNRSVSATEQCLARDSAITLSVLCGNRDLAQQLGQNAKPCPIILDDLEGRSLPNPMLALHSKAKEQLSKNMMLIDSLFPREHGMSPRRLICAIDHTYLVKAMSQSVWQQTAGLVGGFWSPMDEESAFMPLQDLPPQATKRPKANQMLECLVWDPNSKHRRCYSCAEMPMKLKASSCLESQRPDRMAGNREP